MAQRFMVRLVSGAQTHIFRGYTFIKGQGQEVSHPHDVAYLKAQADFLVEPIVEPEPEPVEEQEEEEPTGEGAIEESAPEEAAGEGEATIEEAPAEEGAVEEAPVEEEATVEAVAAKPAHKPAKPGPKPKAKK